MAVLPATVLWAEAEQEATEEVFDLGQVLVLEKGQTQDKITTTDTVSVDDIKLQGAQNVAEALAHIPGIHIQAGKKGAYGFILRGFDERDVKLLIDGVPAHVSYDGSLDLSQIPVDSIAKIEVTKGATSVLHGSNTLGGVVNIITKKGTKTPHTSVTTSFGPNDTQNYIANHGGAVGKFNYWITASRRTSDGWDVSDDFDPNNNKTGIGTEYNEDGGTRDLSYYTNNTLNAKVGYEADNNSKVYLSFDYHDNEKGCPTEDNRYWEFSKWKQWHLNLVGEHDVTDKLTVKARTYYVKHDDALRDVSWDSDHDTTKNGKKWFQESYYDDFTVGAEVQAYYNMGDFSLVKMGISYMKDNHIQQDYYDANSYPVTHKGKSVGLQDAEEYETDLYSFGIEDEIKFAQRWTLKFGTSFDLQDPVQADGGVSRDQETAWNPQAGLAYDLTDDINIYTSVSKKTRFPQMKELYSDLAGGNDSLKPQKTVAYELGTKIRVNDIIGFNVAGFYNDIDDRIVSENKKYLNKGESKFIGVETAMDITTPWNLDLGLGYTYLHAREKDSPDAEEKDAEFTPEHKATFDARYFFDFGMTLSFQCIYTGEQVEHDGSTPTTISDYFVANAKVIQKWQITEKIATDVFVEVSNLFDKDYYIGHGPEPGRNFLVGATFNF